ncbi:MAG: response regulator [bacterium]
MAIYESFERLHILLVDDCIVNQKIMSETLKKAHTVPDFSVEIADSGEQALKILGISDGCSLKEVLKSKPRFDLIVMDVQMMGISGLEVTRIIREEEKGGGYHIPIIGLTASVKEKDKEACFKAGMDFYLAKPISPRTLLETIDYLLKGQGLSSPENVQCEISEPETDGAPINIEMAQSIVGGNTELLKRMVTRIITLYPMEIENMQKAFSNSDLEQVHRLAHRLKGSIGMIGAKKAFELAQRLEDVSISGESDEAKTLLALLKDELKRVERFASKPDWEKQIDNENINC